MADAIELCIFMPPEPLPWDRKDFFKERKHSERSSGTLGGSLPRWRDTPHHGPYRWGSAEFRRPPGEFFLESLFSCYI